MGSYIVFGMSWYAGPMESQWFKGSQGSSTPKLSCRTYVSHTSSGAEVVAFNLNPLIAFNRDGSKDVSPRLDSNLGIAMVLNERVPDESSLISVLSFLLQACTALNASSSTAETENLLACAVNF